MSTATKSFMRPLLLAVTALATLPATAQAASIVSRNWAGYAATGRSFKRVTGTWTVPHARCTGGDYSSAATWVGLGGFSGTSQALEQTGVEVDCSASGRASYSAWYELVPALSRTVPVRVSPGNRIAALVDVRGRAVTLTLRNLSTGATMRKHATMAAPDVSSAEWIVEAPEGCDSAGNCDQLPLANFGRVRFRGARATDASGHTGAIGDSRWSATALVLSAAGTTARSAASTSRLSAGASAFTVTYGGGAATVGKAAVTLPSLARPTG